MHMKIFFHADDFFYSETKSCKKYANSLCLLYSVLKLELFFILKSEIFTFLNNKSLMTKVLLYIQKCFNNLMNLI